MFLKVELETGNCETCGEEDLSWSDDSLFLKFDGGKFWQLVEGDDWEQV